MPQKPNQRTSFRSHKFVEAKNGRIRNRDFNIRIGENTRNYPDPKHCIILLFCPGFAASRDPELHHPLAHRHRDHVSPLQAEAQDQTEHQPVSHVSQV